jgi:hypothetical protein
VAGSAFCVVLCHDYRLVLLEGTRGARNQSITAISSRGLTPMQQCVGVSFYLRTMKPNTTQLAAIDTCIDALQCLTSTNDITSPTHYVDTEAEVDKLELQTGDDTALVSKLCELIGVIRKLK